MSALFLSRLPRVAAVFAASGTLCTAVYARREYECRNRLPLRHDENLSLVCEAFAKDRARQYAIPKSNSALDWMQYSFGCVGRTLGYTKPYCYVLVDAFVDVDPDGAKKMDAFCRQSRDRSLRTLAFAAPAVCAISRKSVVLAPLLALFNCWYFRKQAQRDQMFDIVVCCSLMQIMDKWASELDVQSPKSTLERRFVWKKILEKN